MEYGIHCRRRVPASQAKPSETDVMDESVPEEVRAGGVWVGDWGGGIRWWSERGCCAWATRGRRGEALAVVLVLVPKARGSTSGATYCGARSVF